LAVGGYIVLAGLWSSPVSGASMNPARSFGSAVVTGDSGSYLAGPIMGAALAVGVAVLLRGRGGDEGGRAAARGGLRSTGAPGPEASPPPRDAVTGEPESRTVGRSAPETPPLSAR
jgi:aquaporin Z